MTEPSLKRVRWIHGCEWMWTADPHQFRIGRMWYMIITGEIHAFSITLN